MFADFNRLITTLGFFSLCVCVVITYYCFLDSNFLQSFRCYWLAPLNSLFIVEEVKIFPLQVHNLNPSLLFSARIRYHKTI